MALGYRVGSSRYLATARQVFGLGTLLDSEEKLRKRLFEMLPHLLSLPDTDS